MKLRLIPIYISSLALLATSLLRAAAPVISAPTEINALVGQGVSVPIVANNGAQIYSVSSLPTGLTLSGDRIVGVPENTFSEIVTITATNISGETGSLQVPINITLPAPQIASTLQVFATLGQPFSYQIVASNAPTSYDAIGLAATGLTLDTQTGVISGTPTQTGVYQVLISATNVSGATGSAVLTVTIGSPSGIPNPPQVTIVSPTPNQLFLGTSTSFTVTADIVPQAGEEIASAVVLLVDPLTGAEVELGILQPIGNNRYSGNALIGPNFSDRQVPGGNWEVQVQAYQTNARNAADIGTGSVVIEVTPVLEILYPTFPVINGEILVGRNVASVLAGSNNLVSVDILVQGPGTLQTQSLPAVPPIFPIPRYSEIYNFTSTSRISIPGTYNVTVTAIDGNGNTTVKTTSFEVSEARGLPEVQIQGVPQGYVNDVFVPPVVRLRTTSQVNTTIDTSDTGVITLGVSQNYAAELLQPGAGIYPRNGTANIFVFALSRDGSDLFVELEFDVASGKATGVTENFTLTFRTVTNDPNMAPLLLLELYDSLLLTGTYLCGADGDPARVPISLGISPSTSRVTYYEIFVNGELVRSGDPLQTSDIPIFEYPLQAYFAPPAGDYIIEANVRDEEGKVGSAYPIRFSIVPTDLPVVSIVQPFRESTVEQGELVEFVISVTDVNKTREVYLRNVESGEQISAVRINPTDGDPYFRVNQRFNAGGVFRFTAVAIDFEGEETASLPVTLTVVPSTDLTVAITEPTTSSVSVIRGGPVTFTVNASSSGGISSISLLENSVIVDTLDNSPATFTRRFPGTGSYLITAQAEDSYGTIRGASQSITVTVVDTDLSVSITSPTTAQSIVRGGTVTFSVDASATPGVDSIELFVDGISVGSSTSVPAVFDIPFNTNGSFAVTARATDAYGNTRQAPNSVAVTVTQPSINLRFTLPEGNVNLVQGEKLNIRASVDSTFPVTEVSLQIEGQTIADAEAPYDFTYQFDSIGQFVVTATALDARGNTASVSNPFMVTVQPPNPLVRDGDFVTQTYRDLFYRDPTNTELNEGLKMLAEGTSKAGFVVYLLGKSEEENYTMTIQEYLTMTGEWPNYTDLEEYSLVLITSSTTDALTQALVPEYEERFGALNTQQGFISQTFQNKHGTAPNAITYQRLYTALTGPTIPAGPGSPGSAGFSGNTVAYFTQFALDNRPWAINPEFSEILKYQFPNMIPATHPPYVHAMVGLWRISGEEQVSNSEVNRFAGMPLITAVEEMLNSPRYTSRFPQPETLFPGEANPDGWLWTGWFGWVNVGFQPWYLQETLGWLYSESQSASSAWFYSDSSDLGWFWTTSSMYPFLYRASDDTWYYFDTEANDNGWLFFYNFSSGEWVPFYFQF